MAIFNVKDAQRVRLDTYLMSCRVIGREAETAFLSSLMAHLQQRGFTDLEAEYLPTQKNKLVETFLPDHGFNLVFDTQFERHLDNGATDENQEHSILIDFQEPWLEQPIATAISGKSKPNSSNIERSKTMTTFNQIRETIVATPNISPDLINEDTKDTDVTAWDSLGHVNIMMSLEQTFDIFLEVEDFAQLKSVPAIVEYLRDHA